MPWVSQPSVSRITRCSRQRKSALICRPSSVSQVLVSGSVEGGGAGRTPCTDPRAGSQWLSRARLAVDPAEQWGAGVMCCPDQQLIDSEAVEDAEDLALCGSRPEDLARRLVAATARRVRATLVQRRPSASVTSATGSSVRPECARTPARASALRPRTARWISLPLYGLMPRSSLAHPGAPAAPRDPYARSAARHRPRQVKQAGIDDGVDSPCGFGGAGRSPTRLLHGPRREPHPFKVIDADEFRRSPPPGVAICIARSNESRLLANSWFAFWGPHSPWPQRGRSSATAGAHM